MVTREQELLKLLSNNDVTFFIPPYQRNYEWTSEQCETFWHDIQKIYATNMSGENNKHFFGTITYFSDVHKAFGDPDKLVLIDGQQRITTTMLFLIAMRDLMPESSPIRLAIDRRYLKNENISDGGEYKIKLKQVESDWATYRDIILGNDISEKGKRAAVYKNYAWFKTELRKLKAQGVNIKALLEYGLNNFTVVTVELQPQINAWENPQEIFESMNSLGKPLSLADLVRNFLLLGLNADEQTRLYNKYWLHIEEMLSGRVADFVRDYMQCYAKAQYLKATEANGKKLYSDFKALFSDQSAEDILRDMHKYAQIYVFVIGKETTGSKTIDAMLFDLRYLQASTTYPFLLALLCDWHDSKITGSDTVVILTAFRTYMLRRKLCGLTTAENKNFPLLIRKLPVIEQSQDKAFALWTELAHQEVSMRIPNDCEVTTALQGLNFYSFRYKQLYLAMIEEKLTKSRPDIRDPQLTVEHIMPQTLSNSWKLSLGEAYEDIHEKYVDTIGNLTLIRHNSELGNKAFFEKKKIYEENAGLQIAKTKIIDKAKWGEAEIQDRADWLIELLVQEVLPIPGKMRHSNNYAANGRKKLSFVELGLVGEELVFREDRSIAVKVVSDNEVEFEGEKWKLSPLTAELKRRNGACNPSESYQGSKYWMYDGMILGNFL